jgi:hypothetical protein
MSGVKNFDMTVGVHFLCTRQKIYLPFLPRASGRAVKFYPLSPPQAGEGDPFPPLAGGIKGRSQLSPRELHSPARKRGD